jgi:hypothetical protein
MIQILRTLLGDFRFSSSFFHEMLCLQVDVLNVNSSELVGRVDTFPLTPMESIQLAVIRRTWGTYLSLLNVGPQQSKLLLFKVNLNLLLFNKFIIIMHKKLWTPSKTRQGLLKTRQALDSLRQGKASLGLLKTSLGLLKTRQALDSLRQGKASVGLLKAKQAWDSLRQGKPWPP